MLLLVRAARVVGHDVDAVAADDVAAVVVGEVDGLLEDLLVHLEVLRDGDVLLELLDGLAADDDGAHGKGEDVAQRLLHRVDRAVLEQPVAGRDLHPDHAHVQAVRQRQQLEPAERWHRPRHSLVPTRGDSAGKGGSRQIPPPRPRPAAMHGPHHT